MTKDEPTTYRITIKATKGQDAGAVLRGLRRFLKRLSRAYGLKCVHIETTHKETKNE